MGHAPGLAGHDKAEPKGLREPCWRHCRLSSLGIRSQRSQGPEMSNSMTKTALGLEGRRRTGMSIQARLHRHQRPPPPPPTQRTSLLHQRPTATRTAHPRARLIWFVPSAPMTLPPAKMYGCFRAITSIIPRALTHGCLTYLARVHYVVLTCAHWTSGAAPKETRALHHRARAREEG